jgi:2-polyprenyl-3-methyl-5-hydroxy-6-metoxy-1,4-benzoquinol methylase
MSEDATAQPVYQFSWLHAALAGPGTVEEMAALYSNHYGTWSKNAPQRPGQRIRLSPNRLREWLTPNARIALATVNREIVGYAIAIQEKTDVGIISWITQFVVHTDHQRRTVGKRLLFSIWGFSSHFAWGLITANPYAIRALEKATGRRCDPERIRINHRRLLNHAIKHVPYVTATTILESTKTDARIDTEFWLSHDQLPAMLASATDDEKPWRLGPLNEGWEWFAFTFHDQAPISLTAQEIENMLRTSDQITKQAYSRMQLQQQPWTKHTPEETAWAMEYLNIGMGAHVLDIGCGNGRHAVELAKHGIRTMGIDYLDALIATARERAAAAGVEGGTTFQTADARGFRVDERFDAALCLYDVIGTYTDDDSNQHLLNTVAHQLKSGGTALLSVMNYDLTAAQAEHTFTLSGQPERLRELEPSQTMEHTGEVFAPKYYVIDTDTRIVYRKEQFSEGTLLPEELIVRDKRYRADEIKSMCERAGLKVIWSRYVRAGHWDKPLSPISPTDAHAKEILVLCQNLGRE